MKVNETEEDKSDGNEGSWLCSTIYYCKRCRETGTVILVK